MHIHTFMYHAQYKLWSAIDTFIPMAIIICTCIDCLLRGSFGCPVNVGMVTYNHLIVDKFSDSENQSLAEFPVSL